MKALSIQQPWAWLIANGHKDIENRTWATKQRGRILIHAGKKFDMRGYQSCCVTFREIEMPAPHEFERGGIIGEVEIVDCIRPEDPKPTSIWYEGDFGFVLANAKPLQFVPCNGALGFFRPAIIGEVVKMHVTGQLSEGQASRILDIDRISLRELADEVGAEDVAE